MFLLQYWGYALIVFVVFALYILKNLSYRVKNIIYAIFCFTGDIDYQVIRAVIEVELPKLKQATTKMLIELEE